MASLRNPQYDDQYYDGDNGYDPMQDYFPNGTNGNQDPYQITQPGQSGPYQSPYDSNASVDQNGSPTGRMVGNQWVNDNTYYNGQLVGTAQGQTDAGRAVSPDQGSGGDAYSKWLGSVNTSRYNPEEVKQFYDIFSKASGGSRLPRQDEIDQWLGGYLAKDNINGSGQAISAWAPGSQIDPYWAWRIGTHARGDYNGDNPAELGAGDANTRQGQVDMSQLDPGPSAADYYSSPPTYAQPSASVPQNPSDILSRINALLDNGGRFNSDLVNQRVESARETMEKARKGELANDQAILAAQGLATSGENQNALARLSDQLQTGLQGNIRDIYSEEAGKADDRYAQALALASGMSIEDAKNAVAMAKINSDQSIAQSDIALRDKLGSGQLSLDKLLGLGRLGLDTELGRGQLDQSAQRNQTDLLSIIAQLLGNTQGGYQS